MFVFAEILSVAAIKTLLLGLPESVGLLVFGIGLVLSVVLIRRFIGPITQTKVGDKPGEKV